MKSAGVMSRARFEKLFVCIQLYAYIVFSMLYSVYCCIVSGLHSVLFSLYVLFVFSAANEKSDTAPEIAATAQIFVKRSILFVF